MENIIVVNATALDKSGALTILKQFIKHAGKYHNYKFLCFIAEGLKLEKSPNITFIEMAKKNWLQRILWDSLKLKKYLRNNDINPKKVISLQNTSINVNIDQIIYLHQPLPFSSVKWSLFKKEQFKFFLYKHFYKFFILLFVNKNTVFVVQTNWMKEALCSKSNVDESQVYIIKPDMHLPNIKSSDSSEVKTSSTHILLYPATQLFYKNHMVILEALKLLKAESQFDNIKFQVTFRRDEYPLFREKVNEYALVDNIDYLGCIPHKDLIHKYQCSSLVVFPSYIESFGLPLVEGASLGKPVLCSDFPFSRDVLAGYSGAVFLNYQDPNAWANAIKDTLFKVENNSFAYGKFDFEQTSSWKDFFKLL